MSNNPFLPPPDVEHQGQTNSNNCPGPKYEVTSVEFLSPPGCYRPQPQSPHNIPWAWEKVNVGATRFGRTFDPDLMNQMAAQLGTISGDEAKSFFASVGEAGSTVANAFKEGGSSLFEGEYRRGAIEIGKGVSKGKTILDKGYDNLTAANNQFIDTFIKNPLNQGFKKLDKVAGTTSLFDMTAFLGQSGEYEILARLGIDYNFWSERFTLLEGQAGILCFLTKFGVFQDIRFRLSDDRARDQGFDFDAGLRGFNGLEWQINGEFLGDWGEYIPQGLSLVGGLENEYSICDGVGQTYVFGFDHIF